MNEAGASPDEIPVDYGVDADSLDIGGAITDKVRKLLMIYMSFVSYRSLLHNYLFFSLQVIVVEEAGMSNRNGKILISPLSVEQPDPILALASCSCFLSFWLICFFGDSNTNLGRL